MSRVLDDILHRTIPAQGRYFGAVCDGSRHHSPTPLACTRLRLSEVVAQVSGGPVPTPADEPLLSLCGTCLDNLTVFVRLMGDYQGAMPWEVRREFGNTIRILGMQAWAEHEQALTTTDEGILRG